MKKRLLVQVSDDYQAEICRELSRCDDIALCGVLDWRVSPDETLVSDGGFLWTYEYMVSLHDVNHVFSCSPKIPQNFYINISKYEIFFLKMTDRLAYYPRSTAELSSLFHGFCIFWLDVFQKNKVDAIIFFSTPHIGFDFVGYAVAEVLGLDIRIINRTGFGVLSRMSSGIDLWNDGPGNLPISLESSPVCYCNSGDIEDLSLRNSKAINDRVLTQHGNIKRFMFLLFKCFAKESFQIARIILHRIMRKNRTRKQSFQWISGPRPFLMMFEKLLNATRSYFLLRYYKGRCASPLPDGKYILFAAHFQPERSTMPEGGCFDDHLKAIDVILSLIPSGYFILYKEHPRQFNMLDMRRKFARNKKYYESIDAYEQVHLVNPFWDNAELIAKSSAVATVTGSSGWEALRYGKSCIVFGDAWYRQCEACLHVSELDSSSLLRHLEMSKDEINKKVEKFLIDASKSYIGAPNSARFLPDRSNQLVIGEYVKIMSNALRFSLGISENVELGNVR